MHPGPFVKAEMIEPLVLTVAGAASLLGASRPTLSKSLNGRSSLSGPTALRIEKPFGVRMDKVMRMQASYDIARMRDRENEFAISRYLPVAARP